MNSFLPAEGVSLLLLNCLDRLTSADRGDLNGGKTAISTLAFAQDYDLDQLNNWATFTEDGDTTLDLDQSRTHNDANEITDLTETTGPSAD
ncbi:MAG: hypothetical protein AB7I48_14070 [Planctomycetaceae bacterium]